AAGPAVATVRAGNVIGGGAVGRARLGPGLGRARLPRARPGAPHPRAARAREQPVLRNPRAIRPWQHVLEPLNGYLLLAQRLLGGDRSAARAWNFGPDPEDAKPVGWIAERTLSLLGAADAWVERQEPQLAE